MQPREQTRASLHAQSITLRGGPQVWAFVLPVTLLRLPYSLMEAVIWAVITYWAVGFAPDAGRARARMPALSRSAMQSRPVARSVRAWYYMPRIAPLANALRACACHNERGIVHSC